MQLKVFGIRFSTLLTMKLLILLTVITCLQASAKGYGQNVTLSLKDAPLEKAFKEIKRQTGYSFVYTRDQLKNSLPLTLQVRNVELQRILDLCFLNQPLSFVIEDRYVIVQSKVSPPSVQVQTMPLIDITGKVENENKEALVRATISATKSNKSTLTDENGEFSLNGISPNDVLIVSSVGYYKEEVSVKEQKYFQIILRIAVGNLDEAIIKGYYSTSKRLNTGTVGKITQREIINQPVSNPLATLQGRISGLFITQVNGLPGSTFNVIIRGRNSIQNSNSPLYVIDGVPFLSDADRLTQRSTINANSPFNTINPMDIESIEVLKDADATAIYGSRGANGVILITTKRNKTHKARLDVNIYTGWGKVTRTMDYLNTKEYVQLRREAFLNDGEVMTSGNASDLLNWDTTRYIDWKKTFIGGTAKILNSNLSYSDGNLNTQFSISGNYFKEQSVFPKSKGTKRGSVAVTFNHTSKSNKLVVSMANSYASDKGSLIRTDLTQFINLPPTAPPLFDASGNLNWSESGISFTNPYAYLFRDYNVTTDRLTSSLNVRYGLFNDLSFSSNFGYNSVSVDETSIFPIASQNPGFNPKGSATFASNNVKSWIVEPQLEYNPFIHQKAKLQFLFGSTFQKSTGNGKLIDAGGYVNDLLLNSTVGASTLTPSNSKYEYRYQALFARAFFNWDAKYLLNLTARRDGSSRFGPGKQYGNFGAVGAAWIFSKTKFFERMSFVSFGKIRSSLGITGNEPGQNYQYLDAWLGTQYPYQGQPALRPTRLFNDNYAWEQIKKLELALELGFFNDKLYLVVNRFKSESKNQLIAYSLPNQTGFTSIFRNFPGKVENSGWEFEMNLNFAKNKDFEWQSGINLTIPRNRLKSFPGLENSTYSSIYKVGKSLSLIQGYEFTGINQSTGIYEFRDQNNDGEMNDLDYIYIGKTDPKYFGGFHNKVSYKNFSLDFLLSFVNQRSWNLIHAAGNPIGIPINLPKDILSNWKKTGDRGPYQKVSQDGSGSNAIAAYYMSTSSGAITNASYVRLKNVALSYSLSRKRLDRLKISNCRMYCEAQNLLTITKYPGFDPENQSSTMLPPISMITVGLQINL